MKRVFFLAVAIFLLSSSALHGQTFSINDSGYFNYKGVDAMLFNDYYPEGHQGGVSIIMHGKRVVTNGDIRFDETPGQWQPVPVKISSEQKGNALVTKLAYPDSSRHATGFNPMFYPDVQLTYSVTLEAKGKGFEVTVDLDQPIPERFLGKAGFNLEIFPGWVFGKPYLMDGRSGIYPQQANGPVQVTESYTKHIGDFHIDGKPLADFDQLNDYTEYSPYTADSIVSEPYAVGYRFTNRPDDPYTRFTVTSETAPLKLYDGRLNHNNGWFVLRSEIPAGKTKGAIKWYIEPNVVEDWLYEPKIEVSQVGYMPKQQKVAIIELDPRDTVLPTASLYRFTPEGEQLVKTVDVRKWDGDFFLRYTYAQADFSDVTENGAYVMRYGNSESPVFQIDEEVYDRGVWQPVIEYFLPVQMCHMRVSDKYRVWHDACHMDDATVALPGNLFDGYNQEEGVTGKAEHGQHLTLNVGGWHDAGDYDLRPSSQIGESYILARTYEAFHPEIDVTSIDFNNHVTEIHQPDGKNDILQQIENGALTTVQGYLALGKVYKGIICHRIRQYVLLGDSSAMTDNIPGNADDRWVFVDGGTGLEFASNFAAVGRVLKGHNDTLATHCVNIARELYDAAPDDGFGAFRKIGAAIELYKTTGEQKYFDLVMNNWPMVVAGAKRNPSSTAEFARSLAGNRKYRKQYEAYRAALLEYRDQLEQQTAGTPYGVPYRPDIWGAGWTIQSFGYNHYFLVNAFPDIFDAQPVINALNFVLGVHPGSNQQSFASGVGSESATVGYGLNRADWSYVPGGVVSGTAVIRPDFPELLVWPYLWQQVEYVLGGGSSHYMFLVLASRELIKSSEN